MKTLLLVLAFSFFTSLVQAQVNILVVYHSETGNTQKMAEAVAEGANTAENVRVTLLPVEQAGTEDLLDAHAIIVGSPVYNANVSPKISAFIASWPFEGEPLKNKVGAAFVAAGGISAGEEIVQMNILQSMLIFGMIVTGGGDWTQPFGASAITAEPPFAAVSSPRALEEQFLEKGRALGKRIAEVTLRLHP